LPIENVVLNPTPKRQLNLLNKVKADSNEVQTLENQILKIQIEAEVTALVQDVQIKIMIDDLIIHSQFINKQIKNPLHHQVKDFFFKK
jgi:hypothetical protein